MDYSGTKKLIDVDNLRGVAVSSVLSRQNLPQTPSFLPSPVFGVPSVRLPQGWWETNVHELSAIFTELLKWMLGKKRAIQLSSGSQRCRVSGREAGASWFSRCVASEPAAVPAKCENVSWCCRRLVLEMSSSCCFCRITQAEMLVLPLLPLTITCGLSSLNRLYQHTIPPPLVPPLGV